MCGPFRRFLQRDNLGHRKPLIALLLRVPSVGPAHAVAPLVVDGQPIGLLVHPDVAHLGGQVQLHAAVHLQDAFNQFVTFLIASVFWDSMLDNSSAH